MQSSAISISPSIPLLKTRKNPSFQQHRLISFNSLPIRHSLSSNSRSLSVVSSLNEDSSFNLNRRSSRFDGLVSLPSLKKSSEDEFVVKATSLPESADSDEAPKAALSRTLELGILFGLWYIFNIYFNIYNKQVIFSLFFAFFLVFKLDDVCFMVEIYVILVTYMFFCMKKWIDLDFSL